MNIDDRAALRKQYNCPHGIASLPLEQLEYIERLEQGIHDLARVRNMYADQAYNLGEEIGKIGLAIKAMDLPAPGAEHATAKEAEYATQLADIHHNIARLMNWPTE